MLVIICLSILTYTGGVLSFQEPSRCGTGPSCPKYEYYTKNDPTCLRTCANRHVPRGEDCKPYTGCVCDDDLVRLYDNATGPCIPAKKCPNKCKDPNAVYTKCPSPCPLTCDEPDPRPCSKMCLQYGCECAPGYVLSEIGGKCIRTKDCPALCRKREHYVENDEACLKTCGNRLLPHQDTAGACRPFTGCVCNAGFVRKYDNATGPCIRAKSCPPIPKCGVNEVPTSCRIVCPPQTCDSIFTSYYCVPSDCEPGCDCRDNYLRNSKGVCILSDDCFKNPLPECGPNEIATDCAQQCPPQTCESIYTTYMCAEPNCTAGCNCIDGHLRNSSGVCIPSEDCFKGTGCYGDLNATHVDCGSACPATCAEPDSGRPCIAVCVLNGCQCNPGYILNEPGGVCIAPSDCPGGSPTCGANQTYVGCKVGCPSNYCPEDDSRAIVACSAPYPCPGGCACQSGYLLVSRDDERCILASECPPVNCTRPNEVWEPNPSNCFLERCEDRGKVCDFPYPAQPRCVCKHGYYRNESDICVPESECPDVGCNGDPNAMPKDCPSSCPPTCANQNTKRTAACIDACLPGGCVCKPGFILTEIGGLCVRPEECPGELGCNGDRNATFKDCLSACPLTCADQDANKPCLAICLPSGCECNPGYVLTEKDGKCIKPEDCPAEPQCNEDRNATFKTCPSPCQATCEKPDTDGPCIDKCMPDGCVCKQGYLLTKIGGICIKPGDCPGGSPTCTANETYVYCDAGCPTDYCPTDDSLAEVACDPIYPCPGGCACKEGYLKLSYIDDRCILASKCPPVNCTRPNEVWDPSPPKCLRERCDNRNTPCDFPYQLPPRCVCKKGYYRNEDDICVPESQCFCSVPDKCIRTCASPNPPDCSYSPPDENIDGCDCKEGYILSEIGGKCIKIEDCPRGCNGDRHARTTRCPLPCPSTCQSPNAVHYLKMCEPIGCECEPGYILSNSTGKCILPDECPGQNPCGKNEHFVACKVNCPRDYCPKNDRRGIVICDPPQTCLSGCVCNLNHKRKSQKDPRCIVSSDCPPVTCTRPNEVWDSCPSACLAMNCEDVNRQPTVCNTLVLNCEPACICKQDYFRNATDICIPARDCPCPVPDKCKRTCASPNPSGCPYSPPNDNVDGCDCKEGYILEKLGGKCIKVEDCPRDLGCNSDPNALTKRCPLPCPSTCKAPDAAPCKKACEPIGCQCKPGYLLSNVTGRCILPDDCPGGNPCGENAHFVDCKVNGPRDYCPEDDSRAILKRHTMPRCLPGCICNINHKRKSQEDQRCIVSSDCPPVTCTRPNEVWDSCPSACLAENCKDVNRQPTVCNTLVLNCEPACICKQDYFRNATDICILARDCPCPVPDKCKRTCASPNPSGCPYKSPNVNIDGCDCKKGYILSKLGGKCIRVECCPPC